MHIRKLGQLAESTNNLCDRFIELSTIIATYGLKAEVKITPYVDPSLPFFSKLQRDQQKLILESLEAKVRMFEAAAEEGASFKSNKQVLWHAVKTLGLTPCSDFCEYVTDEDVIEIHSLSDIVQIYHSFSFYSKSSYSIEEICSSPWQDLYETDATTQQNIFKLTRDLMAGEIYKTHNPCFPPYVVKEIKSAFGFEVQIQYRFTSPLFNKNGNAVATISIQRMNIISQKLTSQQEEGLLLERNFQTLSAFNAEM